MQKYQTNSQAAENKNLSFIKYDMTQLTYCLLKFNVFTRQEK